MIRQVANRCLAPATISAIAVDLTIPKALSLIEFANCFTKARNLFGSVAALRLRGNFELRCLQKCGAICRHFLDKRVHSLKSEQARCGPHALVFRVGLARIVDAQHIAQIVDMVRVTSSVRALDHEARRFILHRALRRPNLTVRGRAVAGVLIEKDNRAALTIRHEFGRDIMRAVAIKSVAVEIDGSLRIAAPGLSPLRPNMDSHVTGKNRLFRLSRIFVVHSARYACAVVETVTKTHDCDSLVALCAC